MRAESPADGLDALRQMKLRGDVVAAILADYRMPELNGIEFLEQAMDIYPGARRVLLTAYADTGAAIDAINVVDLDHYLLKPWDPPEEKLYPVVDALLDAWLESDHRPVPETKVVGHRWSARSSEVREFLARNQVPYRWYQSDEPEGQRLLDAAGADGRALPVVITPDGEPMVEPSDAELAARVGLATTPSQDFYDLIVIGGGPAGLGAAVYGASEGLRTVLVERLATGGQAGQSSRIENYLGFPDGVSGAQLTDRARRQATKFGAEVLTTRDVTGLQVCGSARRVTFADGASIDAHTVILATGVSYRKLDAPGLDDLTGRGVYYGSALTEASACLEQDVYVVGGANSAGQAAVYLSRHAKSVTILVRGSSLERSMSYYLIRQIADIPNITVRTCTEVIGASGDDSPGEPDAAQHRGRIDGDGGRAAAVPVHRGGTADRLARWRRGAGRPGVRGHRARPVARRGTAARLAPGPAALLPGDQRAGGVRGGRRPGRLGQAGRLRGRRGCHGGHAGPPLPGESMTAEPCRPDELRTLFLFEKLTDHQLDWLCQRGRVEVIPAGPVYTEGEPATRFYVLLEGTVVLSRRVGGDDIEAGRTSQPGVYAGAWQAYLGDQVPQRYPSSMRVTEPSRFFILDAEVFAQLMTEWFPMAVHLLGGGAIYRMNLQEITGQRERLLALGALSAGLTHELNNPAAAGVRATATLRERITGLRQKLGAIAAGPQDRQHLETLIQLQEQAVERVPKAQKLSPLEASDREDAITDWLDARGLADAWQLAPVFVAGGLDVAWLEQAAAAVDAGMLGAALRWLACAAETELLMNEIEDATVRISTLVGAAKQYSQLDRAPHQTVDVHDLLDSTLTILAGKIPPGVRVVKEYDRSLPAIPAYAAELNQVWTNLIDNAVAAMGQTGVLTVRTGLDRDRDRVVVDIGDTGPGVPPQIRDRIFEPFFTTKPVGQGTGLGLDISWRIVVNKHHGAIAVESVPGDTRFQVWLPATEQPATEGKTEGRND